MQSQISPHSYIKVAIGYDILLKYGLAEEHIGEVQRRAKRQLQTHYNCPVTMAIITVTPNEPVDTNSAIEEEVMTQIETVIREFAVEQEETCDS